MVLDNVRKGGIPCMGTSPGSARAHINQSKKKRFYIEGSIQNPF